jgi:hypothetical protein
MFSDVDVRLCRQKTGGDGMIPSLSRVYTALLVESHLHFYLTPNVTYRIYVVGTYEYLQYTVH